MQDLYLLNAAQTIDEVGDLQFYRHLNGLARDVEAIDVLNGEYYAFTTAGHRIRFVCMTEIDPVSAEVLPVAAYKGLVQHLLKSYLLLLARDHRFEVSRKTVEATDNTLELIQLLPAEFISEMD